VELGHLDLRKQWKSNFNWKKTLEWNRTSSARKYCWYKLVQCVEWWLTQPGHTYLTIWFILNGLLKHLDVHIMLVR